MATDLLAGVAAVGLLVVLLVLIAVFIKAAIVDREVVVVAPFWVTGQEDPDGRLGRSMALMLQSRIGSLEREYEDSQRQLSRSRTPTADPELDARALLAPRVDSQPITWKSPGEAPSIGLKVAGIEFGGIAAWLDRAASRRRTLTLAVHFADDEALVSANLTARPDLGVPDLWLRTAPEPGAVVTELAYALLQGRMTADGVEEVGALKLKEFRTLLESLSKTADLNRRIASGRASSPEDFRQVFEALYPLLRTVPEWAELIHLMAQLAERSDAPDSAYGLYERLRADPGLTPKVRKAVERRVNELAPAMEARERAFIDAVRRYEEQIGLQPPGPEVAFMRGPPEVPRLQATWNVDAGRYEVNPEAARDPAFEMPKIAALLGRFMDRHFERCEDAMANRVQFWNEFRLSLVDFLVVTDSATAFRPRTDYPLQATFHRIAAAAGLPATRRLALQLIDRFDCDWDAATLPDRIAAVAAEVGVPEDAVRGAFAAVPA